ncbi:MAG: single-stranded-DNA-specific exonuclease RecJ [Chthonomonadales bacterium]
MLNPPPKRWELADPPDPVDPEQAADLARAVGCSPFAARLLLQRGIRTAEEAYRFLHPSLDDLPDASLLPDAEAAAERIARAVARREPIIVHGDYDSDGVTSAALWMRLLTRLQADVQVHVPHRILDGYDLRRGFIESARRRGIRLIITCDCGVQRWEEVELARSYGIDVIITDHHRPGERLPRAVAVVNPNRADAAYPFRHLSGAGVAFRTGELVVRKLGLNVDTYRRAYVDLAAIGTVTDAMPLLEENRAIVYWGLRRIPQSPKVGLRALLASAQLLGRPITSRDIAFGMGPRLNAVGRVGDARVALELLLTNDAAQAGELAKRLEAANSERQRAQNRILQEALAQLDAEDEDGRTCIVLKGHNWHQGVVGIVATKIVEQFHRPTILIAADDASQSGRGSARSIPALDIHRAISECRQFLTEFGGHTHAAGLALSLADFDNFREAMNRVTSEMLTPEDLQPVLTANLKIDPGDTTPELLAELARFEPWGVGNDEPIFLSTGVEVADVRRIGREGEHLKLLLNTSRGQREALYWGQGALAEMLSPAARVDLCYRIQENRYSGGPSVQLCIVDLRLPER